LNQTSRPHWSGFKPPVVCSTRFSKTRASVPIHVRHIFSLAHRDYDFLSETHLFFDYFRVWKCGHNTGLFTLEGNFIVTVYNTFRRLEKLYQSKYPNSDYVETLRYQNGSSSFCKNQNDMHELNVDEMFMWGL